jgi:hypothetical protein
MYQRQLYTTFSTTFFVLALALTGAQAGQVQLAWDLPTTATNLAGYKLYYGQARGSYSTSITVGKQTSYTVSGLTDGQTYYFAATAYDSSGRESGYSNEVQYTVPSATPGQTLLSANFNSSTDSFVYVDDTFRGTQQPTYAAGKHTNGAIRVTLGGRDDRSITNMSGGWRRAFTVSGTTTATVSVTFRYKLILAANYESDEYGDVLATVGTQYLGASGRIARLSGDGNGGSTQNTWWQTFTTTLSLAPGTYTLTLGGYNNKKNYADEVTTVIFDNVVVTATSQALEMALAPETGSTNSVLSTPSLSSSALVPMDADTAAVTRPQVRRDRSRATAEASRLAVTEPEVKIWLEAEAGVLATLIEKGADTEASAGQYVRAPAGQESSDASSHNGDLVQYTFTVPKDDTYVIWGRVGPEVSGSGSFAVTLAEIPPASRSTAAPYSLVWAVLAGSEPATPVLADAWVWDQVASDTLPIVFLTAGEYTLTLQPLGSGTRLDRFLITNDLEYQP